MNAAEAFPFAALAEDAPARASAPRIALDPENVRKGLGQLVLTVIELIRKLLEKQALRRIESGSLTDEEIERLGRTLLGLQEQVEWLKGQFGLTDEELNLDLGPLGKLI
jgi:tRNA(Met) C34 N-acetyltransferase TmcA